MARSVRVSEVTVHGNMDCYKIETPSATYVYGKRGAGFASILDKQGRDWVSYQPGGNARGEYRGLPKCGQPTKFFHCGYGYGQYPTENPFSSRVTMQEAGRVRIESETRDGKTACRWDFYPDHATLTLLRIDLPTFWFLYEGTPGGKLDAERDYVIRPDGRKTTLDHAWSEVVPWVCFGASETPIGLVLVNHQAPEPGEVDSYVSWPFRKDESDGSFQDMTVFGFGRKGHEQLIQHVPDLRRCPRASASDSSTGPTTPRPGWPAIGSASRAAIPMRIRHAESVSHNRRRRVFPRHPRSRAPAVSSPGNSIRA